MQLMPIWWIATAALALALTRCSICSVLSTEATDEPTKAADDGDTTLQRERETVDKRQAPAEGDFADRSSDGSYAFRYADRNQFHSAAANKDNVVSGRFGSRSPETGRIIQTSYSAGPRGFRARGPDIARQTDLSQIRSPYSPPVPTDSSNYDPAYDRYHDPNEDPSYKFTVRTPTQSKSETADSRGHVEGVYSYLDDVGKRHDVQYEAGAGTGFHIKSAHPDSDPFGGVFYSGPPGKPGGRPRGHTSVVLGKDGSYGFTASGPDQRRSEVSDSNGRVQGSYTYVDDKGVQRTVQYVAGADIGYRVINNAAAGGAASAAVSVPSLLPGGSVITVPSSSIAPPVLISTSSTPSLSPISFEQDLFGPAASSTAAPPLQPDRRRPSTASSGVTAAEESALGNGGGGGGGGGGSGGLSVDEFLSPDSSLPLGGSAFPEDDPSLPAKKWPTTYKTKDEESFFQSFDKFNKRREQQHGPKKPVVGVAAYAVPDSSSSYGQPAPSAGLYSNDVHHQSSTGRPSTNGPALDVLYGLHHQSTTGRPSPSSAAGPVDVLYGQPSRPIVVDDHYGQYGGTDYQKPRDHGHHQHHQQQQYDDHSGGHGGFGGFPAGTIVKAHVQSLDILPFGYRVPSPSYVLEKQFGNTDGYQNSVKK